jgi:hypothetical protein
MRAGDTAATDSGSLSERPREGKADPGLAMPSWLGIFSVARLGIRTSPWKKRRRVEGTERRAPALIGRPAVTGSGRASTCHGRILGGDGHRVRLAQRRIPGRMRASVGCQVGARAADDVMDRRPRRASERTAGRPRQPPSEGVGAEGAWEAQGTRGRSIAGRGAAVQRWRPACAVPGAQGEDHVGRGDAWRVLYFLFSRSLDRAAKGERMCPTSGFVVRAERPGSARRSGDEENQGSGV